MKRLAASLVCFLAVAGCSKPADRTVDGGASPATAAAPAESSKPENGDWGIDLTGMDASVKPGDDFFRDVNGKWLDRTEIAATSAAST